MRLFLLHLHCTNSLDIHTLFSNNLLEVKLNYEDKIFSSLHYLQHQRLISQHLEYYFHFSEKGNQFIKPEFQGEAYLSIITLEIQKTNN